MTGRRRRKRMEQLELFETERVVPAASVETAGDAESAEDSDEAEVVNLAARRNRRNEQ